MRQSKVLPSFFFYRLPLLFLTLFLVSFFLFLLFFCSELHATFLLLLLFSLLRFASFWFRFVRLLCQFRVVTNASGAKLSLSFGWCVYIVYRDGLYIQPICATFLSSSSSSSPPSVCMQYPRQISIYTVGVRVSFTFRRRRCCHAMRHAICFISLFCFVFSLLLCPS